MRQQMQRRAIQRAVAEALEPRRLLSLAAPVSYAVAATPQAVAIGDFNNDGRSDVVTGNVGSDNVTVRLSNGNGTLGAAQHFATGPARSVAVGDVNHDGKSDIVTTNSVGVSVLLGNGNGTFEPASGMALPGQFPPGYSGAAPLPQEPVSVAAGDLNADGKLDLVVGGRTWKPVLYCGYYSCGYVYVPDYYVNVLLGHGDGTFSTNSTYLQYSSGAIGLADFNGDSKLDAATTAGVMLGNGDGTLQAPAPGFNLGLDPVIGDFDNDGKLDVARRGGSQLEIMKGQGDGTFQLASTLSLAGGTRSVVAGDVNADGKLDLVANTQQTTYAYCPYYCYDPTTTDRTEVLLGFGDNTFSLPITSTLRSYPGAASGQNAVALADLDGDARPDVIATEPTPNAVVTVQLNEGNWLAPVGVDIDDTAVTEGHSGTVNAVLTVTLDHAVSFAVSVPFSTADGLATVAGGDYFANSGTLEFSPGQTSKTITVQVRGDRRGELDEQLYVNLADATNGFITDGQGVITIIEDEPGLSLSTNTSVTEGNSGTKALLIHATLSAPYDAPVTFNYATQGGQATSGTDFDPASGTITFEPGQTSKTISVSVRGDTIPEYVESLFVIASNAAGALWDGNYGYGTIVDDDPGAAVVISNVARAEGNSGITPFIFTLTRLTPSERESFVYLSTSNGSASSGGGNRDYEPVSSTSAHFAPGQVNSIVVVHVRGDTRNESDETFFVNLTGIDDGTIADSQGVGTILNDETRGKTWVGPDIGGNWSTAANWSPSGVPTSNSLVTISAAEVTLSASATVAELSLNGATLVMPPNGDRVLRTQALFLSTGGGSDNSKLDLGDNDLIVDYAPGTANPLGAWNGWYYDGILGAVASGRHDGAWDFPGIVTSRPDALTGLTTLAAADASQLLNLTGAQTTLFSGHTVDATTVLVKYSYGGDANLDGFISGDDYTAIDFATAAPGASGWANGDFNYDGIISGDDYTIIDFNIAAQGPPLTLAALPGEMVLTGVAMLQPTWSSTVRSEDAEDELLLYEEMKH